MNSSYLSLKKIRMQYSEWEPFYLSILSDFGYSQESDRKSAALLSKLIEGRDNSLALVRKGKKPVIIGPKINEETQIDTTLYDKIIVADSALPAFVEAFGVPDVVFTDLDGDLDMLADVSAEGSVIVVHSHGDNIHAVNSFIDRVSGPLIGTCQVKPFGPLLNYGGFTDGDRAAFFLDELGFDRIDLVGFDFNDPVPKEGSDPWVKARKLQWARKLLFYLANRRGVSFSEGGLIRL
ncbi:MAG: DUF115 domain-containing protein [Candidatus Thermoplasmatota archaeon]|nr:DUF115 domain-containing protein [Candidatus Thermoplasmatota archaeon]